MELLNYLQDFLFLSATIFAGMGSGTQSGKLKFKNILAGNKICISDNPTYLNIYSTVYLGTCPLIGKNKIAYGTGKSFGYQNFGIYDPIYGVGIYGFNNITQGGSKNYIYNSDYSMIVGGDGNKLYNSNASVIIGGKDNIQSDKKFYGYNNIISSCQTKNFNNIGGFVLSSKNTILGITSSENLCNSSSISSQDSYIRRVNHGSIISSINTCLYGQNYSSFFSSISSCGSKIKQFNVPSKGDSAVNSTISSEKSCIYIFGQGISCNTSIITSRCSLITNILPEKQEYENNIHSSIISSINSTSSAVSYSSIISSESSYLYRKEIPKGKTLGGTIIGSSLVVPDIKFKCANDSTILFSTLVETGNMATVISSCCITRGKLSISSSAIQDSGGINISSENSTLSIASRCSQASIAGYKHRRGNVIIGGTLSVFFNFSFGGACNYNGACIGIIGGENNFTQYRCQNTSNLREGVHLSSIILGGKSNGSFNGRNSVVGGGLENYISNNRESIIIGGYKNKICGYATTTLLGVFPYSCDSTIQNSFIISGSNNCFRNSCSPLAFKGFIDRTCQPHHISSSGIISGSNNQIFNCSTLTASVSLTSSVIIGGSNVCVETSYTLATHNLMIKGSGGGVYTYNSVGTKCTGLTGTFSSPTQICVVNGLITSIT